MPQPLPAALARPFPPPAAQPTTRSRSLRRCGRCKSHTLLPLETRLITRVATRANASTCSANAASGGPTTSASGTSGRSSLRWPRSPSTRTTQGISGRSWRSFRPSGWQRGPIHQAANSLLAQKGNKRPQPKERRDDTDVDTLIVGGQNKVPKWAKRSCRNQEFYAPGFGRSTGIQTN
jgi:hypothetical protein